MSEPDEHIDIEVLSDLVEGLLPPEQEAELAVHLAECAECRDTRDALAEIRELLGDQAVEPMPADVIARIDGALALAALPPPRPAEPPTREMAAAPTFGVAPEPNVVSLDAARTRRRRGPLVLAAAAAAAVVLGVTVLVGTGGDRDDASNKSGGNPAAAAPQSAGNNTAPPKSGERPGSADTERAPSAPSTAPPRLYSQADLPRQISRLLAGAAAGTDFPSLPACAAAVIGPKATTPLAVDSGTYQGKPAYVVVLPGSDATRVRVYIVDASCATEAATALSTPLSASLLLSTEIARG